MKTVLYARVSSREQEEGGYSIPFQIQKIRQYAKEKNHTIEKDFIDVESAACAGRENFNHMVAFVKSRPDIKGIICHKVDRLCRNFKDYVTIDELGVKPLFVDEEFQDNASGKLHFGLRVLLAKNYSDNLSEEVKKGHRMKFQLGYWPTVAPKGYKNVVNEEGRHIIAPDEKEAPLIRHLFQKYAEGTHSLDFIAEELAMMGLLTAKGNPLTKEGIKRILINPIYICEMEFSGLRKKGKHEPLVSQDIFYRCQGILKKRGKDSGDKGKHFFLLRGLAYCQSCQRKLTAEKHPRGNYYFCIPLPQTKRCAQPYIPVKYLNNQLEECLKILTPTPQFINSLSHALDKYVKDKEKLAQREIDPLKKIIKGLEKKMVNLSDKFISGAITQEMYQKLYHRYETEIHGAKERLTLLSQDFRSPQKFLDKCFSLGKNVYFYYQRATPEEKKQLLYCLFSKIYTQQKQIVGMETTLPFNLVFQARIHSLFEDSPQPPDKKS